MSEELRRLIAAIAATAAVDALPDRRPSHVPEPEWDARYDRLIRAEGNARGELIAYLCPFTRDDGAICYITEDATVITYTARADGLGIVPPDRVRRLED